MTFTFSLLEYEDNCSQFYKNGSLFSVSELTDKDSETWSYNHVLGDKEVNIAALYCGNSSLKKVCPSELQDTLRDIMLKKRAYIRSFREAKINPKSVDVFQYMPDSYKVQYGDLLCTITDHAFKTYDRPKNYDFMLNMERFFGRLSQYTLNIDPNELLCVDNTPEMQLYAKKAKDYSRRVRYDQFRSKTGRLSPGRDTFPALNFEKKHRKILKPNNHLLLELDYNAAEFRTLLGLADAEQPDFDVHEWNRQKYGYESRDQIKQEFFAWLYGSSSPAGDKFNSDYQIGDLIDQYWDGETLVNPYMRKLKCDKYHALNYLMQSTTTDIFLRQVLKVDDILRKTKSHICMLIHDSVIIDLHLEDVPLIKSLVNTMSDTDYGKFLTNVYIGKTFGDMRVANV
jgi:hypothetical protein